MASKSVKTIVRTSSQCSFSQALRRRVRTSSIANTNDGLHINDGNDVINLFKYPSAMSLDLSILWVDHVKSTRNSLERSVGKTWRDALLFKMLIDPRMTWTKVQCSVMLVLKGGLSITFSAIDSMQPLNEAFLFRLVFVKYEGRDEGRP